MSDKAVHPIQQTAESVKAQATFIMCESYFEHTCCRTMYVRRLELRKRAT